MGKIGYFKNEKKELHLFENGTLIENGKSRKFCDAAAAKYHFCYLIEVAIER
jgi:hypothetical protein